jgi:hypothetical protein
VALQAGHRYPFQAILAAKPAADPKVLSLFEEEFGKGRQPRTVVGRDQYTIATAQGLFCSASHSVCWRLLGAPWRKQCSEGRRAKRRQFRYQFEAVGPRMGREESDDLDVEWRLSLGRCAASVLVYLGPVAAGAAFLMGHPHVAWAAAKITLFADQYASHERVTFKPDELVDLLEKSIGADTHQDTEKWAGEIYGALRGLTRVWATANDHAELSADQTKVVDKELRDVLDRLKQLGDRKQEFSAAVAAIRAVGEPEAVGQAPTDVGLTPAEMLSAAAFLSTIVKEVDLTLDDLMAAVESMLGDA